MVKMILVATVLTLVSMLAEVKGQGCDPYLHLGSDHTMCLYTEKACPGSTLRRSGPLTCQEKQEALSAHNVLRQKVALGHVAGQPAAKNMAEMVWDDELATIAQRWAEQCTISHDKNRKVDRFSVGQNLVSISSSPPNNDLSANFTFAASLWFNEVASPGFSSSNISPFVAVSGTLHYTQLVWATTYALGCAFVAYDDNTYTTKLYVCNYGPRGNVKSASMYVTGSPNCASFTNLSNSPRYSGLCVVSGSNPPNTGCGSAGEVMLPWYPDQPEEQMTIWPFGSWDWEQEDPYFYPSYKPVF